MHHGEYRVGNTVAFLAKQHIIVRLAAGVGSLLSYEPHLPVVAERKCTPNILRGAFSDFESYGGLRVLLATTTHEVSRNVIEHPDK
ncbi:MAG: hypothetical protein RR206_09430 [Bacteroidaceae bacterium]